MWIACTAASEQNTTGCIKSFLPNLAASGHPTSSVAVQGTPHNRPAAHVHDACNACTNVVPRFQQGHQKGLAGILTCALDCCVKHVVLFSQHGCCWFFVYCVQLPFAILDLLGCIPCNPSLVNSFCMQQCWPRCMQMLVLQQLLSVCGAAAVQAAPAKAY